MNYGGASGSNPPWARQSGSSSNYSAFNTGSTYQTQQHVNQSGLALPTSISSGSGSGYSSSRSTSQAAGQVKQRVFAGTITKISDNFGFVDDDVFFQTSVCKGGVPKMSDKVLVEATYNANMPFKWNATRIQLVPNQTSLVSAQPQQQAFHQAAAQQLNVIQQAQLSASGIAPLLNQGMNMQLHHMSGQQSHGRGGYNSSTSTGMGKHHSRPDNQSAGNRTSRFDQRDRRDERRDRQRSPRRRSRSPPPRRRSRSPKARSRSRSPRRKQRTAPRYSITISPLSFDTESCSVLAVKNRYSNMYIPSDFFNLSLDWVKAFPLHRTFPLGNSTRFHICPKDVTPLKPFPETVDPSDADYAYSAKVMLLTQPSMEEIYKQCCSLSEETRDGDFTHPTRVLQFLVGMRSKNEPLAIGGPWSPSLDGENPASNPQVLVNTAIRTTRNLTGIDLSACTQWYKFVDISYLRPEETYKGKVIPEHTEHVVIFLPDIWSVVPTMMDYLSLQDRYKHSLLVKLGEEEEEAKQLEETPLNLPVDPPVSQATIGNSAAETSQSQESINEDGEANVQSDGGDAEAVEKPEPTHWSKLDPKTMKVLELRTELEARNVSCKGLKTQLQAKLSKLLKVEMEAEEEKEEMDTEKSLPDAADPEETPLEEEDEAKQIELTPEEKEQKARELERLRVHLEKLYVFPEEPVVMVHPNRSAKNGKFDCSVMSLSVLLDYRPEDNKEHSFEVSLFAESFNEMLSRDFGFCVYKKISSVASKPEEKAVDETGTDKGDDSKASGDKDKAGEEKESKEDKVEGGKRQREQSVELESKRRKKDDDDDDKASLSSSVTGRSDRASSIVAKKKEPEKRPQVTVDKAALLAFVYYDTTRAGYIMDKDLEDMIYTLGLQVSRAQVRALLQKVCTPKDNMNYRTLTDRPEPQPGDPEEMPEKELDIVQLAEGNRRRIGEAAVQERNDESNVVVYQGAVLELDKVLAKMDRSELSRLEVEKDMRIVQEEREALKVKLGRSEERVKKLTTDLKRTSDKLSSTKFERNKREDEVSNLRDVLSTTSRELHRALKLVDGSLVSEVKESKPIDKYTPSVEALSASVGPNNLSAESDDKQGAPLNDSIEMGATVKEEAQEAKTESQTNE
ncbi:cell division cycle and apoptosis regulator protein 1-like [Watersipora subatra]|uniref:cell division cycle and apoptosis regulator protein 1-like n=1 Tax=Watersipora subatra TaxID=2589382 RepID=UPI00355B03E7